ncbi:riboflavine-aldehyde-forming enzyme [Lentinus tigrinus ALCF2SS1-6]|uniref:Riboflavine-aldehyde-forming enzyme n=1 Tax=Lentinus tigrinus ALCF2SS1-6 TaxID=1328759 RepID=A0A5C2SR74_9APHY|nr:riboflavine-aldehyde-forming enzyme [Lentinus tigrinus ALCF2SS1-6]
MQIRKFMSVVFTAALFVTGLVGQVGAIKGSATHFTPGLGACGVYSQKEDIVVAVGTKVYAKGKHCKERMRVQHMGKTIQVTMMDECPGCNDTHIDLGEAAFKKLADVDVGVIEVTWDFISGSDSGDC